MKKRFILLIDFSEYSQNLLKYAYDWSKQCNAELLLVHQTVVVVPALADIESRKTITQHTNTEALLFLQQMTDVSLPPAAKVTYHVSEMPLQATLHQHLAEPFKNLIFVGLKGTGLLKKIFIGSMAIQIIEHVNNLIVAIPKEIDRFLHKKIFVAVTDQHSFNTSELNNFLDFISQGSTDIVFFYLAKPNEENLGIEKQLQELATLFAGQHNTSYTIYEGNSSFEDIKKVVNNKLDELLVVQRGSRLLTDQLFRKFLINELVYEGQLPLVVLP